MMKLFQRKHQMKLVAPVNGMYIDLRQAGSGSQGATVGFGIEPMVGEIQAPIAGTITQLSTQRVTITAANDCEVIVQLGQVTDNADEANFDWSVAVGDAVTTTTQLANLDVGALHAANQSAIVTCFINNKQPSDFVIEQTGMINNGDLVASFKVKA